MSEQGLLRAESGDVFTESTEIGAEIAEELGRPRFARAVTVEPQARILDIQREGIVWLTPAEWVTDCRDPRDNKYHELAVAAGAGTIIRGNADMLVLNPPRGVRVLRPADYLADVSDGA